MFRSLSFNGVPRSLSFRGLVMPLCSYCVVTLITMPFDLTNSSLFFYREVAALFPLDSQLYSHRRLLGIESYWKQ